MLDKYNILTNTVPLRFEPSFATPSCTSDTTSGVGAACDCCNDCIVGISGSSFWEPLFKSTSASPSSQLAESSAVNKNKNVNMMCGRLHLQKYRQYNT